MSTSPLPCPPALTSDLPPPPGDSEAVGVSLPASHADTRPAVPQGVRQPKMTRHASFSVASASSPARRRVNSAPSSPRRESTGNPPAHGPLTPTAQSGSASDRLSSPPRVALSDPARSPVPARGLFQKDGEQRRRVPPAVWKHHRVSELACTHSQSHPLDTMEYSTME